ncbi:MAG: AIR synthase related protein [Candidatus Jordarchaeales archaeon]
MNFVLDVESIASSVLSFEGVRRKRDIRRVTSVLRETLSAPDIVVRGFGEDAAILDVGWGEYLLLAVDSMWHLLIDSDPFFAGYCSVLVNVNDVVAKGGRPICLLDSLNVSSWDKASAILDGMVYGCKKFLVPVVGGHLQPDAPTSELSVAVAGLVDKGKVVFSDTASPGDLILLAVDMHGKFHEKFPYAWDTTSWKTPEEVRLKLSSMWAVAEAGLATAAKDISNPGAIGTLAMLLEASGVGGIVDVRSIPMPEGVEAERWVRTYPGFGVVLTAKPENASRCLKAFEERGVAASVIGEVTPNKKLILTDGKREVEVFNFKADSLSGKPD